VQTANDLVIMYEANSGLRNIFTDGRVLPTNDPQPWWFGYSVGKYEGDALVVQTIGCETRDGWTSKALHSRAARRLQRSSAGRPMDGSRST